MQITKETIRDMLGLSQDVELASFSELEKYDLEYRMPTPKERDTEILNQLKRIKADNKVVGTPERTQVWENGWNENLEELRKTNSMDALMPKWFREGQPFRLYSEFIYSKNPKFEFELRKVIQRCCFELYFKNCDSVYDFGCGTGVSLVELNKLFPDKKLFGCDLTESSVKILEIINKSFGINVSGSQFDVVHPVLDYHLNEGSGVFTVNALEQTYDKWGDFLDYLLREKPSIVMHLEPISEMYDKDVLIDWLALQFHEKRNYLKGYYTKLLQLEKEGKIQIIEARRTHMGNLNDETFSLLVWKPIQIND